MLKFFVFCVSGVMGFLVAFSITAKDEIGAEVAERLDRDFVEQCTSQMQFPAEVEGYERSICSCMKVEYDRRGIVLTDVFNGHRSEMQSVANDCAQMYAPRRW